MSGSTPRRTAGGASPPVTTLEGVRRSRAATLDIYRGYIRRGLPIIPIPRGSDRGARGWPTRPIATLDTVDRDFVTAPGGGVSDVALRLGAADGGYVDVDCDCPEAVAAADAILPPTRLRYGRPANPNSHRLYRLGAPLASVSFADPDPNGARASLVELRADTRDLKTGFRARIPPSHHKSGERYAWDAEEDAPLVDGATLRSGVARVAATALLARRWQTGARHHLANALAGALTRAGWPDADVVAFVERVARVAGDEEIAARATAARATCETIRADRAATGRPRLEELTSVKTVAAVVAWLGLDPDVTAAMATTDEEHYTDTGLARRLVARFGDEIRYCGALGGWHVFDSGRWRRSERGDVEHRLHVVVQSLWDRLADPALSSDERKRLFRFASTSEGAYHLKAALEVASTDPRVIVAVADFDADPWLFNVANGTLNLKDPDPTLPMRAALRRLRRDHAPGDLLRLQSPVAFDPIATAPKFEAFLRRIFGGKRDVIAFVQRFVGYALTGSTGAQQFYLWHGDGANGKSQLITILRRVFGDYAVAADYDTFVLSHRDVRSARPDLVRLVGARFVSAVETKHVRHLDEGLLKQVTGGDPIVCRTLYREPVTFTPQFKLVLCANDKPTITGTDHAIWRRTLFLPFTETIRDDERIDNFAETVIAPTELPGVLRWAVEGCLRWQREGLGAPPTIAAATAEYRSLQDTLAPFFEDHCVEGRQYGAPAEAIHSAYYDWAVAAGHRPLSMKSFGEELRRRGYERTKIDGRRGWRGVAVRKHVITE